MAKGIHVRAPAKLNLGLRIVGIRPDGYHELSSLFVPLDLADELTVEVEPADAPRVEIRVEKEPGVPGDVPSDERNLAARAAQAFLEDAGLAARVRIQLAKRIPSPGGLGGGSSDAAAVLRALAEAFPGALPPGPLAATALRLGADVPFFLGPEGAGPAPAHVAGIGERVTLAPGIPELSVALVHPGAPLETARVYGDFDAHEGASLLAMASLTASGPATTMPAPAERVGDFDDPDGWLSSDWLSLQLTNDLEPAARRLAPEIGPLREALEDAGARAVGLSGSGPTLFGIFADASAASEALAGTRVREALDAAELQGQPVFTGVARTLRSGETDGRGAARWGVAKW